MASGRTASVVFLGNSSQLNAELARVEAKLKALSDTAESENAKMAASSEAAAGRMGKAFDEGSSKAGGALHKLGSLGASWGVPFSQSLENIGQKLDQATTKTGKMHEALAALGKVTLVGGLAGFAAAAYEGVKAGEKFQSTTASMAASAGISQKAAEGLGKAFLDTMGHSTFSGQAMASAYASVAGQLRLTEGQALSTAQATTVMEAASKLAEASQIDLGTATGALANVMQAYHLGVSQAAGASNTLFNTSKALNVPVDQVAQAVDRLHGRLGMVAPNLTDTSTLMAEMATHGITGSRGLMAVNSAFQTMLGSTPKVHSVLQALGVDLYDSQGRFIGLQGAITQLQPKLAGLTQQQQIYVAQTLFGKSAGQAMLGVILSGNQGYQQATAAVQRHNAVQQAATAQSQTLHGQMETLKATVQDLATKFGMFLIPKLEATAQAVSSVITWLERHKQVAEALAIVIGSVLGSAVTVFVARKAASLIRASEDMVIGLSKVASFMTGGLVPALTRTGTGITDVGVKATTATPEVEALGAASATTGSEIAAAGTEADVAAGQLALFGTDAAAAVPEVEGLTVATDGLAASLRGVAAAAGSAAAAAAGVAGAAAAVAVGVGGDSAPMQTYPKHPPGMPQVGMPSTGESLRNYINATLGLPPGYKGGPITAASYAGHPGEDMKTIDAFFKWLGQVGSFGAHGFAPKAPSVNFGAGLGFGSLSSSFPTSSGSSGFTQSSFAVATLVELGIAPTPQNIKDFTAWEQQEGGNWANSAKYNPLNTTQGEPGAKGINSANVKAYTSWAQGLAATVQTLKSYPQILAALKAGASPAEFSSIVAGSKWGTGAITAPGQSLSNDAIQKLIDAAGKTKTTAPKKVTYGPSQNVLNMLQMAEELAGTPYTKAGHAAAFNETVAQIRKFGTDCSGLVSVLLKEGISGIRAAQTTQGLPTNAGLAPGVGKYITVYDRHTGPVDQEHTFIEILGHYFEEGGVLQTHAGEMTKAQVAQEMAGGGFEAFHPTASYLNQAVAGAKSSAFSAASAQATLQQAIDAFTAALIKSADTLAQKLGDAIQNGTLKTLENVLGVSTSGSLGVQGIYGYHNVRTVVGHRHGRPVYRTEREPEYGTFSESTSADLQAIIEGGSASGQATTGYRTVGTGRRRRRVPIHHTATETYAGIGDLTSGDEATTTAFVHKIDTALQGTVNKLWGGSSQGKAFNSMIAQLLADGQKAEAEKLLAVHKAALATLAQELYAQQVLKDGELLNLQATQLKDQTQLQANTDAAQLDVTKAQEQKVTDAMNAQVTAIRDMTQIMSDRWSAMAQQVEDSIQQMADSANAVVSGINDQTQIQVDVLGERGLYGLNLVAQKLQVQSDETKAYWDQQIALAQQQLDSITATENAAVSAAQLNLDQVTAAQNQLVALSQQADDTAHIKSAQMIAAAQAHADAVTLHYDTSVIGPAQMAVDMNATAPKSQQDIFNAVLRKAQGQAGVAEGQAGQWLEGVTAAANKLSDAADYQYSQAQATAAIQEASAQQTLATVQGQASYYIDLAKQNLQGVTGAGQIAEAEAAGATSVAQARAQAEFAGTGTVIQIYGVPLDNATAIGQELSWAARTMLP